MKRQVWLFEPVPPDECHYLPHYPLNFWYWLKTAQHTNLEFIFIFSVFSFLKLLLGMVNLFIVSVLHSFQQEWIITKCQMFLNLSSNAHSHHSKLICLLFILMMRDLRPHTPHRCCCSRTLICQLQIPFKLFLWGLR